MFFGTKSNVSEVTLSAVVTRADGRVEDLGVISYWNKSLWKRLRYKFRKKG